MRVMSEEVVYMEHQMEEEKLNFELEIILDMEIMGKICSMFFAFIENICFYLAFPPVPQFRCFGPFVMVKQFPFRSQADHIILLQMVEDEKYLIVIITAVHNKGGLSEKSSCLFDSIKCDGIYRFIVLLSRRMDPGKDTDRMLVGSQGTGFRYVVAFFINIFHLCTFRAIADNTKRLKLFSIRFYNITFIDEDYWFGWDELFHGAEIRSSCRCRSSRREVV